MLELFIRDDCPYCHRVLNYMRSHDIELVTYDINYDANAVKRLVEVGGKRQVPCLFIDGAPMYESTDIIEFLAKKFG